MKQRSKVIATSIATIAMCASLAVGGTFALFTSESEVNIAVTSGTVDVKAYADKATLSYTSSLGETLTESSATIVENVVKIDKIVPGDTIEFDLVIENYSNVTVQYQTVLSLVDGVDLFTGLQIEVDKKVYDGMTAYSNWTELKPIDGENKEFDRIPVTITLPKSAGDEYQTKTAEISFIVKAVQGNAAVEQPAADENTLYVYSENDMKLFAHSVNKGNNFSGKTVMLMSDIDLNNEAWTPIGNSANKFQGTFDGNGKTVSNLYVEGEEGLGLFGYVFNGAYIHDVTIDGAYVSGEDYLGAVVGKGYATGIENCVVNKAEIIATPYLMNNGIYDGGAKAGVVAGYVSNCNVCGNSATDSSVSAYRDLGGIVGYMDGENRAVVAENNSVENVTLTYLASPNGKYEGNIVNQNMNAVVGRIRNATVDKNTTNKITYNMADGLKYESLENGGLELSSVGAYASETLNVPTGVTALGNKVLNGNTTIKEVIIPSTLTVFGGTPNATGTGASGGFFYQSAVEKITLPEGLTEIPAAAFNQAANLKEVNIPSSVTTIGINAFAGSGLETLTIPETVTSIGYGAFRDMLNLTTVTIEGDEVYIPNYTFRACASLTTIYMNVNALTLQTGNMAFTNTDTNNENPNNITIYVTNDQVYNTLTSNTNVKCTIVKVGEIAVVNDKDSLQNALDNATNGAIITLADDITGDVTATQKPDVVVTIQGNGYTYAGVIVVDGKSATYTTAGLNINNVKFVAESISADACINLGVSGDNNTRYTCNVTVSNCTFDVDGAVGVKSYTGGDKNLTIKDCTTTERAHSLVQAKGIDGVLVEKCNVYSKNGMNFNNSDDVKVNGCTVDVKGYAVRFGESSGGAAEAETYTITGCTLKSACDDGDAVIILRGTADYATLTIENTTIEGTITIANNATNATVIGA